VAAGGARSDGRISVVFFGLFTPLQGAPVIARALAECERRGVGLDVTLVGDGQDAGDVRRLPPRGGGGPGPGPPSPPASLPTGEETRL